MKKVKENLKFIEKDLKTIVDSLGNNVKKIGLFGSVLDKEISDVNDIDVVLYIKNPEIEKIRTTITQLPLRYPVRPQKINDTYGLKTPEISGINYHVIVLYADNPNPKFEEINKDKIFYI